MEIQLFSPFGRFLQLLQFQFAPDFQFLTTNQPKNGFFLTPPHPTKKQRWKRIWAKLKPNKKWQARKGVKRKQSGGSQPG